MTNWLIGDLPTWTLVIVVPLAVALVAWGLVFLYAALFRVKGESY